MQDYTCPNCKQEIDQILEDTRKYYYWFFDEHNFKMMYQEGETSTDNKYICPICFKEINFEDFENHYLKQGDDY